MPSMRAENAFQRSANISVIAGPFSCATYAAQPLCLRARHPVPILWRSPTAMPMYAAKQWQGRRFARFLQRAHVPGLLPQRPVWRERRAYYSAQVEYRAPARWTAPVRSHSELPDAAIRSGSETLLRIRSLAGFIISTLESRFRKRQGRQKLLDEGRAAATFQSTPPREGRPGHRRAAYAARIGFNPRPRERGAPKHNRLCERGKSTWRREPERSGVRNRICALEPLTKRLKELKVRLARTEEAGSSRFGFAQNNHGAKIDDPIQLGATHLSSIGANRCHAINGPLKSWLGFAPICSMRRFQFAPRK